MPRGHSSKNLNGQMVSPLRTLFFGELFTDNTQCRVHGLPPAAYSRVNPQSDKLNSVVNNPFFLVDSVAARMHKIQSGLPLLNELGPSRITTK